MKKIFAVIAALFVTLYVVACSSPSSSSNPPPDGTGAFILTANVNGTPYSAAAKVAISDPPAQLATQYSHVVAISSTSLGLIFFVPINPNFPLTITDINGHAIGTYVQGAGSWTTADSTNNISIRVDSLRISAADTNITAGFSFAALGGYPNSVKTVVNINNGTLRKN